MNSALARSRVGAAVLFILLLQSLLATPAQAWWNRDWPYRMKLTADAGAKGAAITDPIGRTLVLIRLHSGNFPFETATEDGGDLKVISGDDHTPLNFHLERFDGLVDQVALIWVDIPDLAPGATTNFYLYWGNLNVNSSADAKATYDPDQLLVYHFADANGVSPHDSTGNGNNALAAGARDEGGMIGYGLKLDGTAPIRIPASPSLTTTANQPMTWSMWIRPRDGVRSGTLYSMRDGANAFSIGIDQGVAYAQIESASGIARTSAGAAIPTEGWQLVSVTVSDHLAVYVDGEARGQAAASLPAMHAESLLGGTLPPPPQPDAATPPANGTADTAALPAAPPPFVGQIDEFRISKVVRPLGAMRLWVHNEGPQADLLSVGPAEQGSIFGNGYLAIIVRSVTPDAWVVIGILLVMAVTSWVVMVSKALYIGRLAGANRAFRQEFHAATARAITTGNDFQPLPQGKRHALRRSPLFHLYDIGLREMHLRVDAGRLSADGMLSAQSIASIRAALETGLVEEGQRLGRMMVLLTIAISGGPFLGLLGTVVGVMITFAAIAQAGDVNVNAIAPGVAAALLATVTGLAVAIPALFGYNYFVTRIRDANADMQVFANELVTRMGEFVHRSAADERIAAE